MNWLKTQKLIRVLIVIIFFITSSSSIHAKLFRMTDKKEMVDNINEKFEFVNVNWWDNFNDPYLKNYVYRAIENNHDAKKIAWKCEEYRQFVKVNFSKELPMLSASTIYTAFNTPNLIGNKDISRSSFILPFFTQYEADLLLKNHDITKSSKKTYEASKFDEKSAYISLVTNVGTVYINILKYDSQICLLEKLVKVNKEILKRESDKFNRGVISVSDLNMSKKELDDAKINLDERLKAREKLLNQLAVLIGDSPENSKYYTRSCLNDFEYRKNVPCEICSDVIFSRPDVLSAEILLEKNKIDIRVAKKEFFPRFNIIGFYSFNTLGGGNFFGWRSSSAAIIGAATQDLFRGGLRLANLRISNTRFQQAFEAYKQVNLTAVQEVNDSLYFVKEDTNIDKQTLSKFGTETDSHNRNINRFRRGVISKTDLLASERQLLNTNIQAVDSKTARLIDYLTLYKAVGGNL